MARRKRRRAVALHARRVDLQIQRERPPVFRFRRAGTGADQTGGEWFGAPLAGVKNHRRADPRRAAPLRAGLLLAALPRRGPAAPGPVRARARRRHLGRGPRPLAQLLVRRAVGLRRRVPGRASRPRGHLQSRARLVGAVRGLRGGRAPRPAAGLHATDARRHAVPHECVFPALPRDATQRRGRRRRRVGRALAGRARDGVPGPAPFARRRRRGGGLVVLQRAAGVRRFRRAPRLAAAAPGRRPPGVVVHRGSGTLCGISVLADPR
mmetsp:Transcript_9360/g.25055  ORF Transcript_9360/g.25055 Transcript_9360/m.25055 type:complete len:266 (-) Transcript_9360:172-969(-)